MFRTLEDCIETLEEAGSRFWVLKGNGTDIKHEPEDADATADTAIEAFQKNYGRIGAGVYTLEHRKTKADRRGAQSFRFSKAPEVGAAVGSPSSDVHTYLGLHQEIQDLKHQRTLDELKRQHAEELRQVREKAENEAPGGMDKFIQAVAGLNQLLNNPAAVAGLSGRQPAPAAPAAPVGAAPAPEQPAAPDADADVVVNELVQGIHKALGEDEAVTMDALRKLARTAQQNPAGIKQLMSFIN